MRASRRGPKSREAHLQILCRGLRRGGLEVKCPLAHRLVHIGSADPGQGGGPGQPGSRKALRQQVAQSMELTAFAIGAQQRERLLPSV